MIFLGPSRKITGQPHSSCASYLTHTLRPFSTVYIKTINLRRKLKIHGHVRLLEYMGVKVAEDIPEK
jgi:hypothetical protein